MANFITRWLEKRFNLQQIDPWKPWLGRSSKTGVNVTEDTALRATAVWACVRLLAETVSTLPLFVYRRLDRGKERATDHPLYPLLHDSPNPEMPSCNFREMLQAHLVTWGNCYAEIDYGPDGYGNGYPQALWPLLPHSMQIERDEKKQLRYIYTLSSGERVILPSRLVLHIPGLGYNGIKGYAPITMAREAIGLSMATEEFGAQFFGNGATFGGFLKHPNNLSKEAQDRLLAKLEERHQGLDKAHRLAILEEGMDYKESGIPPEDAQFLETRQFQVVEIARFFNVPPHMIMDLSRATFSNIEQQSLNFVIYTARPWLVRWEQWLAHKLLSGNDRQEYFIEHLIEGLLRGDSIARAQFYNQLFMDGVFSPNDILEKENMNPYEGGDDHYIPLNMIPVGSPPPMQQNSTETSTEKRTKPKNYGLLRSRIARSYHPVFREAAHKIVKQERTNILKAAKSLLGERSLESWEVWLEDYYRNFGRDFIERIIKPAMDALAGAIQELASKEVGATPQEIEDFIKKYIDAFVVRYSKSSKGQLKQIVEDAIKNNKDPLEEVQQRVDEWLERRPDKVAMNETVQMANAVARVVFVAAAITTLIWVNTSSEPCPYCEEMDGRVVGVEKDFVAADTKLESDKGDMKIYRPCAHPPLHNGCQCTIMPG